MQKSLCIFRFFTVTTSGSHVIMKRIVPMDSECNLESMTYICFWWNSIICLQHAKEVLYFLACRKKKQKIFQSLLLVPKKKNLLKLKYQYSYIIRLHLMRYCHIWWKFSKINFHFSLTITWRHRITPPPLLRSTRNLGHM